IDDASFAAWVDPSDRAASAVVKGVGKREERLAHAVPLQNPVAGRPLERREVFRRQRGASGGEQPPPGKSRDLLRSGPQFLQKTVVTGWRAQKRPPARHWRTHR